jgi:hypothetical protein
MGTPKNHPVNVTMNDWMRSQEKRVMHEERRPRVTTAADILGPGFGPTATPLLDWNAEEARFNGFFYSEGDATNAPHDDAMLWMGTVISTGHHAIQVVYSHGDGPIEQWMRSVHIHENNLPSFTAWAQAV